MAKTGGRTPFDQAGALSGPARTLWAPLSTAVPVDLYDVVAGVADASGEYPAATGWFDFGLAADAPSYAHERETEGLEYQQPKGALFEKLSTITRSFTAQIGEIDPENMKIVEQADAIETIAAASQQAVQKKVAFGIYNDFTPYRVALVSYRPAGSAIVTEPAPSSRSRPPCVGLVFPKMTLSAESSEFEFSSGDPVNAAISFTSVLEATLGANKEHGYWVFEQPGVIAA